MRVATTLEQRAANIRHRGIPRDFRRIERRVPLPTSPTPVEILRRYEKQLTEENIGWIRKLIFLHLSDIWKHLELNEDPDWVRRTDDTSRLRLVVKLLLDHIGSTEVQTNPAAARVIPFIQDRANEIISAVKGTIPNENLIGEIDDANHHFEAIVLTKHLIERAKRSALNMPQDPQYISGDIIRFLAQQSD